MLVQLSDPHVVEPGRLLQGRIDTPALLAQSVAAVAALQPAPKAVVVTGDLVERASAAQYAHLRALLAPLPGPVWLIPGNHDDVAALRAAFPDHDELTPVGDPALAGHVLWAREVAGLRVVALDTVVPRAPHGTLCERRLAWLDSTLAAMPDRPTIVAMHHPPFVTGIAHMDAMGLREGVAGLEAVLRRHPQVERVICGHLHRNIVRRFGGTVAMTVPSTAHQIVLDLRADSPAAYRREPPGFAVHAWRDGALVSHVAVVGDHGPAELYD
ncbi:MAG: phosphodiesterase [Rubrivivax sp.]|nr:phosphodiesterase [Rubrivivax sp.]